MAMMLAGCVGSDGTEQDAATQDGPVSITVTNAGAETLHCRLMFGHWVDRDLGTIAAGESLRVEATQAAADGALYILRADGQRRMMIETLSCGRDGDWMASRGQVDLAPLRAQRVKAALARCDMHAGARQASCRLERIEA